MPNRSEVLRIGRALSETNDRLSRLEVDLEAGEALYLRVRQISARAGLGIVFLSLALVFCGLSVRRASERISDLETTFDLMISDQGGAQ